MKTNDAFNIYTDRLRGGHVEEIDEAFSPDFLEVSEDDLKFSDVVAIQG